MGKFHKIDSIPKENIRPFPHLAIQILLVKACIPVKPLKKCILRSELIDVQYMFLLGLLNIEREREFYCSDVVVTIVKVNTKIH